MACILACKQRSTCLGEVAPFAKVSHVRARIVGVGAYFVVPGEGAVCQQQHQTVNSD
jgi:hypothetical protein